MAEVAMKWLNHHSPVISTEGVTFEASRLEYFTANLSALSVDEPLPQAILSAIEQVVVKCIMYGSKIQFSKWIG